MAVESRDQCSGGWADGDGEQSGAQCGVQGTLKAQCFLSALALNLWVSWGYRPELGSDGSGEV